VSGSEMYQRKQEVAEQEHPQAKQNLQLPAGDVTRGGRRPLFTVEGRRSSLIKNILTTLRRVR